MNCQACQIEIEELELGESLSETARAHIRACSECRAFHDERQSLRRLVRELEPVTAPPDFEFRLRARINATSNGRTRHFSWRTFLSSAPAIALAASFVLLVAGVIIYRQMKSSPATGQSNRIAKASETATGNEPIQSSPETIKPDSGKDKRSAPVASTIENKKQQTPLIANSKNPVSHQPKQIDKGVQQSSSTDIGFRPAPRLTPANGSSQVATANQLVQLPVRSPLQPVRVSLDEKGGARRTVTLEPVVFGSQDITGRNLTRNTPRDIW
jgi:hypothetical protein